MLLVDADELLDLSKAQKMRRIAELSEELNFLNKHLNDRDLIAYGKLTYDATVLINQLIKKFNNYNSSIFSFNTLLVTSEAEVDEVERMIEELLVHKYLKDISTKSVKLYGLNLEKIK